MPPAVAAWSLNHWTAREFQFPRNVNFLRGVTDVSQDSAWHRTGLLFNTFLVNELINYNIVLSIQITGENFK